jgi:RNA polymerase sigma-70 factor (ECF subfamily)
VKSLREDDDLVARARAGDEAAWAELYRSHAGRLIAWLHTSPSGDAAAAPEDIAADAWLTAAQNLRKFSGSSDDFAGWLFSIARNVASNRRRTSTRRATSPHDTALPGGVDWGTTEDGSLAVNGNDATRRLLSRLSRREAEVIACIDVVGLDVSTTSRALGISATAVRVARHRGLKRLRAIVSAQDPAGGSAGQCRLGSLGPA